MKWLLGSWLVVPLLGLFHSSLRAQSEVPAPRNFTIVPDTFVPGKTYTVVISAKNCAGVDLGSAKILASGSGVSIDSLNKGMAQSCDWTGTLAVSQDAEFGDAQLVIQRQDGNSLLPIHVTAKAAGVIPPGLKPTVDVAWRVLPRRPASDNFGARVTKLYYPIEVVIGNNSGYDLQIAAVLFEVPTTNSIEQPIPTDSYYIVRSSLEREQLVGTRNSTVNIVKALGPILTGAAVFFNGSSLAAVSHKNIFQGAVNLFSNPFEKGLELVFPDQTVRQLVNLDNHTLRDGAIVPNNTEVRTIVFLDKDFLQRANPTLRNVHFFKSEYDPQAIMAALGSLKLVGRSIQYLNRVSVISNAPGPAPLVTGSTSASAQEGGAAVTLTLTGDSLAGAKLTSPDAGLVISDQKPGEGGKSFSATVDPKSAVPKPYQLTLTTAAGTISVPFEVKPADIQVTTPPKGQAASAIVVAQGAAQTVNVVGTYLKNVDTAKTDCAGVTIATTNSPDGTTMTVTLSAATTATVNTGCTLTLTGKSGNTQTFAFQVKAKTP